MEFCGMTILYVHIISIVDKWISPMPIQQAQLPPLSEMEETHEEALSRITNQDTTAGWPMQNSGYLHV